MPKQLSEKLSSMRSNVLGKQTPVTINLNEGETLDQAEARVMSSRPEVFGLGQGSGLGKVPGPGTAIQSPSPLTNPTLQGLVGAVPKIQDAKSLIEMQKAITDEEKTDAMEVGKTLSLGFGLLDQSPSYSGIASRAMGPVQSVMAAAGMRPELKTYKDVFTKGYLSKIAKSLFGEKGTLATSDIKRAAYMMPDENSSTEEKALKAYTLKVILENQTGLDWGPYLDPFIKKYGEPKVSDEDKKAVTWAAKNRKDPAANLILLKAGILTNDQVKDIISEEMKESESKAVK